MSEIKTVGVIGLGAIGMGTANSLLRSGLDAYGCDIRPEALEKFAASGGKTATTPAELGKVAQAVIVMVINASQAREALFGASGLATTMPSGGIVISSVTMSPQDAIEIGQRLSEQGIRMIDAPSSGGAARAEQGKTSFMASGAPEDFEAVKAVFDATSERIYRVGDRVGQGSTVKTVHQLMAGVHIAVGMEALAFGIKMGVDPATIYEVVTGCAGNSWMFENRAPHILKGDVTPLSAVDIFVKDLGIVLDAARSIRFPLPISAAAHQQYLAASAAGYGKEDDSAVIKVYRDLAGFELPKGPNPGK